MGWGEVAGRMRNGLTQKQETFCLKYFELGNATEAALIAGYSPKNSRVIGSDNLTKIDIQDRMKELRQVAEDASVATVIERKQRLSEILRATIPEFQDEGGGISVKKGQAGVGAVSEITTRNKMSRKTMEPVVITNLKLHSPIQAIAELNKMEKIYTDGTTVNVDNRKIEINVVSEIAREATERITQGERTE